MIFGVQLDALPCTDAAPGDAKLKAYAEEYLRYYKAADPTEFNANFGQDLLDKGCEAPRLYRHLYGGSPQLSCSHPPTGSPLGSLKPLEIFCPGMHTCARTHACTHAHTHARTHIQAPAHAPAWTDRHLQAHARTHTHTRTLVTIRCMRLHEQQIWLPGNLPT